MCSAGDTDPEDGGTPDGDSTEARDRLIDRTIAVVGAEGAAAATVRRIAADVGVSPALVLHHFGSKAGLLEACEARVTARIDEVVAALSEGSSNDAGLQQLLATPGAADAIVYIGRAIGEGSEPGRRWFDLLYDRSRAGLDAMAEAGALRPSDDPTMQALLLLSMDLGLVLLRTHAERVLGGSLTDPDITTRWIATELDLLRHGAFVDDPSTPTPESP